MPAKLKTFKCAPAKYYWNQGILACLVLGILPVAILLLLTYPVYVVAKLLTKILPNYGKILSSVDACLYEEFVTDTPESSIVVTLVLDGDMSLDTLRAVFQKNVLDTRCPSNPNTVRYPELKHYLTTVLGFGAWRIDDHFNIAHHIFEEEHNKWNGVPDFLGKIHESFINRSYMKYRSPWELVLMRHVPEGLLYPCKDMSAPNKTLLVFRQHHVMADVKSISKMLVECLGMKQLKTANAYIPPSNWKSSIHFVLQFPFKLVQVFWYFARFTLQSLSHPWRMPIFKRNANKKSFVVFSSAIQMRDVKTVATKYNVTGSAVIINLIAGAIQKADVRLSGKKMGSFYVLPKPNHPEVMTNHAYICGINLPMDEHSDVRRLQKCNKKFLKIRTNQQGRYTEVLQFLNGSTLRHMTGLPANIIFPCFITNNAGEREGFSVNEIPCEDYRLTVGTLPGTSGVSFVVHSYREELRVAVIGNESVLSREIGEMIAEQMGNDLQLLS